METLSRLHDIPRLIRVGPLDYTVAGWAADRAGSERALGMCDRELLAIWIKEGLPVHKAAEVLLHEVLHAIYDVTGLGAGEPETREERIVAALGFQLLQVWRDNPALVAFFERVLRPADTPLPKGLAVIRERRPAAAKS
ncbi:MAG: hypothetical protein ACTHOP_23880 [Mesorhizobium sp.]